MSNPSRPTKAERKNDGREKARLMREAAERRQRRNRTFLVAGVVVAVLAVVLGIGVVIKTAGGNDPTATAGAPQGVTDTGGVVTGKAEAPVTVAVYLDYQCPACKAFEAASGEYLQQQQDDGVVKLETHPISILDRFSSGTEYSTRSASAALCVAEQAPGAFTTFTKEMFANQPPENASGLTDDKVATIATLAGAPESVQSCIEDGTYRDFVTAQTEQASKDGLPGTPWVLVNGTVVENAMQPEVLQAAIAKAASAGRSTSTGSPTNS